MSRKEDKHGRGEKRHGDEQEQIVMYDCTRDGHDMRSVHGTNLLQCARCGAVVAS